MSEWTDADVEAVARCLDSKGWHYGRAEDRELMCGTARALLASGVVVPARVVEEAERKLFETQEHIAYHLRDFRPTADMAATGDLAVDMGAFADRMKSRAERAEADLSRLRDAVEALAGACEASVRVSEQTESRDEFQRGYDTALTGEATDLRALLTEGRDRAGEGTDRG